MVPATAEPLPYASPVAGTSPFFLFPFLMLSMRTRPTRDLRTVVAEAPNYSEHTNTFLESATPGSLGLFPTRISTVVSRVRDATFKISWLKYFLHTTRQLFPAIRLFQDRLF